MQSRVWHRPTDTRIRHLDALEFELERHCAAHRRGHARACHLSSTSHLLSRCAQVLVSSSFLLFVKTACSDSFLLSVHGSNFSQQHKTEQIGLHLRISSHLWIVVTRCSNACHAHDALGNLRHYDSSVISIVCLKSSVCQEDCKAFSSSLKAAAVFLMGDLMQSFTSFHVAMLQLTAHIVTLLVQVLFRSLCLGSCGVNEMYWNVARLIPVKALRRVSSCYRMIVPSSCIEDWVRSFC